MCLVDSNEIYNLPREYRKGNPTGKESTMGSNYDTLERTHSTSSPPLSDIVLFGLFLSGFLSKFLKHDG